MRKFGVLLLALAAVALDSYAVETRFWQQTDQSDFEKGTLTNLSLRSDGRLFLAPEFRTIFDPSTPYLWTLAADGKGHVYAGGGGSGGGTSKLFVMDAHGNGKTLCELEGLEIHAIALDRSGQIYAATDPDGKIYKISPQGKSALFFDPHEKYIWALAFDGAGNLFAATGDQGNVYRIGPDGKGAVFFKTGETHARSIAVDGAGNLLIGTEPGGVILRVSPAGIGFVLYQTPKREITALAVAKSGEIYASGVGTRTATPAAPSPSPLTTLPVPPALPGGAVTIGPARLPTAPPSFLPPTTAITGGSDVYRIDTDNAPQKVWSNTQDIVYAIGFDFENRPLFATGNRGKIYRLDSAVLNTQLIDASPTQVTSFAASPDGHLYVATGNIGRVYELDSKTSSKGTFESDVLDGGSFSYWGRFNLRGSPRNATIFTRSGNLNRPQENWSAWMPLQRQMDSEARSCSRCLDGRVASPAARFLQYKVELTAAAGTTPEVASVEVAYLNKNIAPRMEEVEVTPPNYRFPAATTPLGPSTSLTLPPLGQKRRTSSGLALDLSSSQTLTLAKGMMGARWTAADDNGDALIYTVDIRGVGETAWKLLKDKVHDKYVTFDSTAFPDGEYELRVTASDSPGNPPGEALSSSLTTDPFLVDNTPPKILNLTALPAGGKLQVHWKAHDDRSIIDRAEYSLNGGDWIQIQPVSRLSDSLDEDYSLSLERAGTGENTIAVRVTDAYENQTVSKVVVK